MSFIGRRLLANRAGNVALTFALLTPLLALLAGGAVDVTNASMRQAQLQQAVDAAAVGAISRNAPGYLIAKSMAGSGPIPDTDFVIGPSPVTIASNVQAIFTANWRQSPDTTTPIISGNADQQGTYVYKSGSEVDSKVTGTTTFSPSFLGLLKFVGFSKIAALTLTATSTAADNIPAFVNINLLLDNSPSMALPALAGDITRLINMTANNGQESNCAFACHATNKAAFPSNTDENIADFAVTSNGLAADGGPAIVTRIQTAAQSVAQLLNIASATEQQNGIQNEFNIAIYALASQATNTSTLVNYVPTTSDMSSATSNKAAAIDVMTVPSENTSYSGGNNDEDTDLTSMLTQLYNKIDPSGTNVGNGSASVTPQQVIFLVSDGISDAHNCSFSDGQSCREQRPIGADSISSGSTLGICDLIKSKGIQIAIIYTTYIALDDPKKTNPPSWYDQYIYPFTSGGPTPTYSAMQSCASPGLMSEVQPNQSIPTAMTNLFKKIVANVRITG